MKKLSFKLLILALSFAVGHTAWATVTCTHGVEPASGAAGTSCTVTANCTDDSGQYPPSTSTCSGAFVTVGDINFCQYNINTCTVTPSVVTADDVKGNIIANTANTLASPTSLFTSIQNAILTGIAVITRY